MPPFRAGLLKRKTVGNTNKATNNSSQSSEDEDGRSEYDLLKTVLQDDPESDETNSEASDNDQEEEKSTYDLLEPIMRGDSEADEASENSGSDEEGEPVLRGDAESESGDDTVESSDLTDSENDDDELDSGDESGEPDDSEDEEGSQEEDSGAPLAHSDTDTDHSIPGTPKLQPPAKTLATKVKGKVNSKTSKKQKEDTLVAINSKPVQRTNKENNPRNIKKRNLVLKGAKKVDTSSLEKLQKQIDSSHISQDKDEYQSGDSSDEEDRRNTVGDVPMWWYNDYPHVGYNLDGRKIIGPPQRDHIEEFLKKCEDPDFWRTVRDPSTGQDVVLSREDLELIARIKQGRAPTADHDEYAPWVEWFTREVLQAPVRAFPEHKRSFLPSQVEQKKISRLVHSLKMGWLKTRKQLAEERRLKREKHFYNLWGSAVDEEERLRGIHKHIPAPRRPLPGHAESYNPPPEYLLDSKEMKEWNKLKTTPWKRKYTFLPTVHGSLREVPAYERYTRERFLRCLDLYLAPRAIKMRLTIDPQDLVPKLPSPRDLQPFPTTECLLFRGHTDMVRAVDFDPSGQYAVSGSDDGTVKVWEVSTGRCLRTVSLGEAVRCVLWTPAAGLSLLAAAAGRRVLLLNPGADIGSHRVYERTDDLLEEPPPAHDIIVDERTNTAAQWEKVAPEDWARGVRISIDHFKDVKHLHWHARGDYVCATLPEGAGRAVLVHQLSRRRSQLPFAKSKGLVQCAVFHPVRPFLFVATQRVVRVYDLVKQELVKKLLTGAQWISTMAVHPQGDNLLVASYERKCMWFDLDLSSKPYQTLRLHGAAVRAVAFHPRYPLFATAGDDRKIIVSHGMVYNDLLQNPLLVPLKQLWGHEARDDLAVLALRFHPHQPWLLSAGADDTLRLFT